MRISDWSSDVCSSDLMPIDDASTPIRTIPSWSDSTAQTASGSVATLASRSRLPSASTIQILVSSSETSSPTCKSIARSPDLRRRPRPQIYRSEEHTSELQSLMRISYAVFCLKKNNTPQDEHQHSYATQPDKDYTPK